MTAAKKLSFAVAIVAAGYGSAWLVDYTRSGGKLAEAAGPSEPRPIAAVLPPRPDFLAVESLPPGGARLVPDPKSQTNSYFAADNATPKDLDQRFGPLQRLADDVIPIADQRDEYASAPKLITAAELEPTPRARLRDEAPRALVAEPDAPPTVRRLPLCENCGRQLVASSASSSDNRADGGQPTQFTGDGLRPIAAYPASGGRLEDVASYVGPSSDVTPPPWPALADADEPRKHIVIDGDSLARLAGRYLDDPRRAAEIYEMNRSVLRDPELLPIGVELVIPPRSTTAGQWSSGPQSFQPPVVAIHTPVVGGLVPVRPIPRHTSLVPRAQLAAPRPVE